MIHTVESKCQPSEKANSSTILNDNFDILDPLKKKKIGTPRSSMDHTLTTAALRQRYTGKNKV